MGMSLAMKSAIACQLFARRSFDWGARSCSLCGVVLVIQSVLSYIHNWFSQYTTAAGRIKWWLKCSVLVSDKSFGTVTSLISRINSVCVRAHICGFVLVARKQII